MRERNRVLERRHLYLYVVVGAAHAGAGVSECGRALVDVLIWAKDRFTLGRSDYHRQYEPILYGWPEGKPHYCCGDRDQSDVWSIARVPMNDLHPTMKPVELVERAITKSSRRGETVLDAFGGSGTTIIACEKTGRRGRLIELDPKYVDVIVKRWQEYTGRKATLSGSSRTFTRVANKDGKPAGGAHWKRAGYSREHDTLTAMLKGLISWDRWDVLRGRRTAILTYNVLRRDSQFAVNICVRDCKGDPKYLPYSGSLYVDPETGSIWHPRSSTLIRSRPRSDIPCYM